MVNEEKTFFCDMCQNIRGGDPIIRKVDSPFNKSTHGKVCNICVSCAPVTKEWNEVPDRDKGGVYKPYWER